MEVAEAIRILEPSIDRRDGTWVDLGAGDGLFTQALVRSLDPDALIVAVEKDARALRHLHSLALPADGPRVRVLDEDVRRIADYFEPASLTGAVLGNLLHFLRDPGNLLSTLHDLLAPDGRAVVFEYQHRRRSPWVPWPISEEELMAVAAESGFAGFTVTGRRPSRFGGDLYAARLTRSGSEI